MSNIIRMDVHGAEAVVSWLDMLDAKTILDLQTTVRKLAGDFEREVVDGKLSGQMVNRVTGNLASSVRWDMDTEDGGVSATISAGTDGVGSLAPYAADVEYGTEPHLIQAINAKALAFSIGGQMIFRKSVNHPGTAPRPFMGSTLDEMRPQIVQELTDAVARGAKA